MTNTMTPEILNALGMTKEEMAARIVDQCADRLLSSHGLYYGVLEKAIKDALKTVTDGLTVNVAVKR